MSNLAFVQSVGRGSRFIPANETVIAELRDNMGGEHPTDFQPALSGESVDAFLDRIAGLHVSDEDATMFESIEVWNGQMDDNL